MATFRAKIWTILGSVVGVSGCSGKTTEADLREGLEAGDFCVTDGEGSSVFSHVTGLNPEGSYDYYEFRLGYSAPEERAAFEEEKASYLASTTDSLEVQEATLGDLLAFGYDQQTLEAAGECSLVTGCDRFFLPESAEDFWSWSGPQYLLAQGADGPTFVTDLDEARAFLGAIDTPQEAAWLAFASGYTVVCTGQTLLETEDGYELYAERGNVCGSDVTGYRLRIDASGEVEVVEHAVVEEGDPNCAIGRLPQGHVSGQLMPRTSNPLGEHFANNARLEAASVIAFLELAQQLEAHGAPMDLVDWARRASREERRHAELCSRLACRFGSAVGQVSVASGSRRSLREIALENAVEGLTREAFGAVLAHHQMLLSSDPEVRRVMAEIARDEANHAEFSIALHRWVIPRLSPSERGEVQNAWKAARLDFRAKVAQPLSGDVEVIAGMPNPEVAGRLFDELFSTDFVS